jgi:hypothetical protein
MLSILFFSLFLFLPTVVQATYSPSSRKPPSDHSRAGGSRGCPGDAIPLTSLAPNTFVGTTTSLRPTFVWFTSKAQPTEFRLSELDANNQAKQIGVPQKLKSIPGINQLVLPSSLPSLTVGKRYLWQVSIDCQGGSLMQRAEFLVVQKTPNLEMKLSSATNDSQKANIYAEAGLWYEALEQALKVAPPGKLGQTGAFFVKNLVQWDNLVATVIPNEQNVREKEIQQRRINLESITKLY